MTDVISRADVLAAFMAEGHPRDGAAARVICSVPAAAAPVESQKDKYKAFRNLMTNELGITRADIEAWTKEAVSAEVLKMVGRINVEALIKSRVDDSVRALFKPNFRSELPEEIRSIVRSAVAGEIAGRIQFVEKS